jgi:hypothetical protein
MAEAAFKPERDYTKEADTQIPEAEQLAKVRKWDILQLRFGASSLIPNRQTSMPPSRSSLPSRSRRAR